MSWEWHASIHVLRCVREQDISRISLQHDKDILWFPHYQNYETCCLSISAARVVSKLGKSLLTIGQRLAKDQTDIGPTSVQHRRLRLNSQNNTGRLLGADVNWRLRPASAQYQHVFVSSAACWHWLHKLWTHCILNVIIYLFYGKMLQSSSQTI